MKDGPEISGNDFADDVIEARNEAREAAVRRACEIMGWPYKTSLVFSAMRAVANGKAVAVSIEKLHLLLDRISPRPGRCEHGVQDGEWCEPCNLEMKTAAQEDT